MITLEVYALRAGIVRKEVLCPGIALLELTIIILEQNQLQIVKIALRVLIVLGHQTLFQQALALLDTTAQGVQIRLLNLELNQDIIHYRGQRR